MKASAPGLREARVRDLARERMLDCELPLARKRRAGSAPDEIAPFEELVIRLRTLQKRLEGRRPNLSPDAGRCLECGLFAGREEVDSRREHPLHRVRNLEALRQLLRFPPAVRTREDAVVDQR